MNAPNLVLILFAMTFISFPFMAVADDNTSDTESFNDRIVTIQRETCSLCSHIEQKMLIEATSFKRLMGNAHIHCPDYESMKPTLANMETMASQHRSFVKEHLNTCHELCKMLTSGLANGGLVVYYLKEGNYSLVTSIIDNWHKSLTNFRATLYVKNVPVEILLENSKIFYHDSWSHAIGSFIIKMLVLVSFTIPLAMALTWIGSVLGIVAFLYRFLKSFRQKQSSTPISPPSTENVQSALAHSGLIHRRTQIVSGEAKADAPTIDALRTSTNPLAATPTTSVPDKCYVIIMIILWIVVFGVFLAAALLWDPAAIYSNKSVRRNWYPDGPPALEMIKVDTDDLQGNLSRQIHSIEELQRHASMYHDKAVQENVNELVRALVGGVRQANKELSEAYASSERAVSVFRQTYGRIEAKAIKAGKLAKATDLLGEVHKSADSYEALQRTLAATMIHQQKLLPILKEQTQSMRAIVQQDRLIELGRIINFHQDVLIDIEGYTYKVHVEVKQVIDIVSNGHTYGMKNNIESLKDECFVDQIKAGLKGVLGTGGVIGGSTLTYYGILAIKTGYAMATVTAATAASPILLGAGGLSVGGFAAYYVFKKFDDFIDASSYKAELAVLETERLNVKVALEQLAEAIVAQQNALKSSQSSLNRLAEHSGHFSKIPSFILNKIQRSAINDELLNLMTEYNKMMAIYALFMKNAPKEIPHTSET